jgi:hypothetical protein
MKDLLVLLAHLYDNTRQTAWAWWSAGFGEQRSFSGHRCF